MIWLVRALLIIDFIFSFYYDVLGCKFNPIVSVFISHDVRQVSLEQRFLLSLEFLVILRDDRRHHFLLDEPFLVV